MNITNSLFFTEDHESIRALARDFAEKSLAPVAKEVDETDHFPETLIHEMAELGFFGLKIPEEYGGLGLDVRSYVCVMEELSRKCPVASIFVSSANSLGAGPLLLYGTDAQKKAYLPGIANGESLLCFGLTEPDAGSDAAAIHTKAVKSGEDYILNGRKCFITKAPMADYTVVFAKTAPEMGAKGITAFLVDMKLPGVSTGKPEEKMGQRGIPISDVILEDVRVGADCIIGEVNAGFTNAMKTLNFGRLGVAAMSLGMAGEALDLAVKYVKDRVQFGKPLAEQQSLRFMLADMQTQLSAARLLVYDAAYRLDQGEEASMQASMAKYFATEASLKIITDALQLHGGYGYTKEYAIERLFRDSRVNTIYEGSSQVQQMVIAKSLLR